VDRLNASPAVFDREKLWWMNAQYLSLLDAEALRPHLEPFLEQVGLKGVDLARLAAAVNLHRTRAKTLKDLAELVLPYFRDEIAYDPEACAKFLKDPDLPGHLGALRDCFARLPDFNKETVEAELRSLADERGIKAGALIHPTRMALSGAPVGPPLFDLVEVMGREATLRHLDRFLAYLRQGASAAVGNTVQAAQG
jgi:glutamyl/glutaminyl-tRNA synthetase